MAYESGPQRWKAASLLIALCSVVATAQAQGLPCPPPSDLQTVAITHDSAAIAWKSTPFERKPLHCVCISPGRSAETCAFGKTPPNCDTNVTRVASLEQNLNSDTIYTMCVQTQCSDVRFSSPVCTTFRTSLKAPSAQYQVVDAKRSSSSLDIKWRVPRPPKGRPAGYRLRWCQSSKCVTTENLLQGQREQILSPEDLQPYRQYTLYASAFSVDPSSGEKLHGDETSLIVYTLETYEEKETIHLQIKAVNSSTLLVSWPEPSADPTLVTWWKANQIGSRPATTENKTVPATSTRFFIEDLELGATYHIVLSRGDESNGVETPNTTMHTDLHSKPDAVRADVKSFSRDSVVLVTWDASRFAQKETSTQRYSIRMCSNCKAKAEDKSTECESITVPATEGRAVFRDVKDACQYKVEVRALIEKPDGRTDFGEPAVAFFTTTAALRQDEPDPYEKPDDLRTIVKRFMNASLVTVTWKVVQGFNENDSPVHQYAVKLCSACDEALEGSETACRSIAASASVAKAVFHGLKDLCDYRVEVRALVETISGGIDEGEPAVTQFTTPPPSLPKLRGSLHAELQGSRVKVHWTSPPVGLDGYEVYYHVRLLGPRPNSVIESTVNGTEHRFTDLEPGANYSVDLALCISRAERRHCGANTTLEFQTLPSDPSGNVSELNVSADGSTELQVSWNRPIQHGDVTHYQVSWWRDDSDGAGTSNIRNFTVTGNETNMTIDGLEASTSYTVEVTAVYERRDVTWRGSPTRASASTDPDGPPQVKNISITTTNRTQSSSNLLISWATTNAAPKSLAHVEFYVTICIGADKASENCRNQTVSGVNSNAEFPAVKNYAAVSVTVRPFIKASGRLIEGEASTVTTASWTSSIPSVRELTVEDITATSCHVSWSEVTELIGIDGGYYGVILSTHPEEIGEDTPPVGEHIVRPNNASAGQKEVPAPPSPPAQSDQLIVFNVTTSVPEIELRGLKPWTNYTVAVYPSVAGTGFVVVGNASSEVFETPAEPPSKPRNVSVVERHDDHYLTWLPPESWNGPRSGYEVSITCMSDNVRANSTSVAIDADKKELKIPRLSPGVPCSLGIYAYNVYQGEPLDGAKVRVRFTPPKREPAVNSERPPTV